MPGGITPIDGARLDALLGNQPDTTKEEDMHPGLIWSRQEMAREEAERLSRVPPAPSATQVLAERYLHGVRAETAEAVILQARALLDARPGAQSRDAVSLAGQLLGRLDQHRHDLARGHRGVGDLEALLRGLLEAEGR